jgi:hypothetical protein
MIDHSRRLIFVHIQKTGGNAICTALGQPVNPPEKHFTAVQLRRLYGDDVWNAYFKFSIVRNPWDRLVSWWSMIDDRRPEFERGAQLNRFHTFILENARTFDEFVYNCGSEVVDRDGTKSIYKNQLDYILDENGKAMLDHVGRFEDLGEEFRRILATNDLPAVALPHENASKHKHYSMYYTNGTKEYVAERYAKDIRFFGYRFAG